MGHKVERVFFQSTIPPVSPKPIYGPISFTPSQTFTFGRGFGAQPARIGRVMCFLKSTPRQAGSIRPGRCLDDSRRSPELSHAAVVPAGFLSGPLDRQHAISIRWLSACRRENAK
jgi:hypothetical protein